MCAVPNAQGAVFGTIYREEVRFAWRPVHNAPNASGVFDFVGTMRLDNRMTGSVYPKGTSISLNFTADKQQTPQVTAPVTKPYPPPVDPDQQLMDTIERRANRLFPWAANKISVRSISLMR